MIDGVRFLCLILGLDIGGTRIKAGLVGPDGSVTERTSTATPDSLDTFRACISGLVSALGANRTIDGVGIGCRGVIRADTLVERLPGTMNYLEGTRLSDFILPSLPESVIITGDNDARAAMAGEFMFGAARGRRDAVMLTLGTGVGGAALVDGQIVRGHAGVAGHIGHMTVDPDGPYCICGNRGCLETRFSSRAIELEAIAAIHRGCESLLRERFQADPMTVTCEAVFTCAADGDRVARDIRDRALTHLAGAIAGLLHIFDPEVVILGGQIAEAGDALFGPLRIDVYDRTKRMLGRAVPLIPAEVGDRSGIVGAASLAICAIRAAA